jgi:hypothetical protein
MGEDLADGFGWKAELRSAAREGIGALDCGLFLAVRLQLLRVVQLKGT